MSNYTTIEISDYSPNSTEKLYIELRLRQLNAEEYSEVFDAVRNLQRMVDKYIHGAPVIYPDERAED